MTLAQFVSGDHNGEKWLFLCVYKEDDFLSLLSKTYSNVIDSLNEERMSRP